MRSLKVVVVILVSIVITALGIDASDSLSGKGGTMLSSVINTSNDICPTGMVEVGAALTFSCVDEYELSAGSGCVVASPQNQFDTEANISQTDCRSESLSSSEPWRFISREQAAVMCARSGKRLPTAAEWYQFALGTDAKKCNVDSGVVSKAGNYEACTSAYFVKNTVGNVWEWVSDDVISGQYNNRQLPETGYVKQVDNGGMATVTTLEKEAELSGEYFWSIKDGAFAIIRGGYYGSQSDAGVFAVHAHTLPTFSGNAVGFRCVL